MAFESGEGAEPGTVYEVHCRECDWGTDGPVDLKGEANLVAGRHISETGHVVVVKTVKREDPADDFRRGGRPTFETIRPAPDDGGVGGGRPCGPAGRVVKSR